MRSKNKRFGFTLVEVLVTTIVIGVLAAVVVPAMMRQTTAADPAQMASDLINIRIGLESFMVDARPYAPGDIEDLINPIADGADQYLTTSGGTNYPTGLAAKWKGPYLARSTPSTNTASGASFPLGSNGNVDLDLFVCGSSVTSTSGCPTTGISGAPDMITIKLNGITATEFSNLNQLIDGTETVASTTGLLRSFPSGTVFDVYFMALPFTAP